MISHTDLTKYCDALREEFDALEVVIEDMPAGEDRDAAGARLAWLADEIRRYGA